MKYWWNSLDGSVFPNPQPVSITLNVSLHWWSGKSRSQLPSSTGSSSTVSVIEPVIVAWGYITSITKIIIKHCSSSAYPPESSSSRHSTTLGWFDQDPTETSNPHNGHPHGTTAPLPPHSHTVGAFPPVHNINADVTVNS
jgi:hypothetical protein